MNFAEALRAPSLKQVWPWIWTALPALILLQYQAVAPVGHWSLLFFELPYLIGILAAACSILILPFLALRRAKRLSALAWLLAAVIYLPLAVGGLLIGSRIRFWAFDRLALRSAPLVSAIRSYEAAHGQPPPSLAALVPTYLPRVPRTGMMAYPDYRYYVGAEAHRHDNNPWALIVHTPSGGINFDQFMYFPLQNYPTRGYGGSLVRIRDGPMSTNSNEAPNHALQRTAPGVTAHAPAAFAPAVFPHGLRRPPQSLSLGSLGA